MKNGTVLVTGGAGYIRSHTVRQLAAAGYRTVVLDDLSKGSASDTFNCGYGRGYSVREVLKTVEKVSGVELRIDEGARRAGDAAELVAHAAKLSGTLEWTPRHQTLDVICSSAYRWETVLRKVARRHERVSE